MEVKVGYPAVARIMAEPGVTVFKRFGELNAQNLLYMQAELLLLENELKLIASDDEGDENTKDYATSWRVLLQSDSLQLSKILELREKLEAYNRALIQQAQVAQIPAAQEYDHDLLQRYVYGDPAAGRPRHIVKGIESRPFRNEELHDMVVLHPRPELDSFTRILAERLLPWLDRRVLHRFKKSMQGQEEAGLRLWNDKSFTNIARTMGVLISTLFPAVAVLALYYIPTVPIRLGMILVFSLLFSGVLAAFTQARPIEIFAATAACASVQVVFVGSTSTLADAK